MSSPEKCLTEVSGILQSTDQPDCCDKVTDAVEYIITCLELFEYSSEICLTEVLGILQSTDQQSHAHTQSDTHQCCTKVDGARKYIEECQEEWTQQLQAKQLQAEINDKMADFLEDITTVKEQGGKAERLHAERIRKAKAILQRWSRYNENIELETLQDNIVNGLENIDDSKIDIEKKIKEIESWKPKKWLFKERNQNDLELLEKELKNLEKIKRKEYIALKRAKGKKIIVEKNYKMSRKNALKNLKKLKELKELEELKNAQFPPPPK